ncbi:IS66-like element accessory protein TnpA, partial [Bradyrhizobium murdochi]|uniref:IS66-like element accessory protein TnpA n=1 Tax=Bradyrhizobium murdochi TaxID=1038859 RepID=UPI0005593F19
RRRWSEEEKARIVLESLSEPRLVAATARRYGLSRSLLVTWRRAFAANRTKSEAGFVRAVVAEDGLVSSAAASSRSATAHSTEQRIEIELTSGRRIIVDASVDVEALRRIIEALDPR